MDQSSDQRPHAGDAATMGRANLSEQNNAGGTAGAPTPTMTLDSAWDTVTRGVEELGPEEDRPFARAALFILRDFMTDIKTLANRPA